VAIRGIQEGHPKAPHILSNQGGGYGFDNCPYLNQKKQPSKPLDNDARDE